MVKVRRMILQSKVRGLTALLAMMVLAAAPAWSQEEAGEDEGRPTHSLSFGYEGWYAQPAGLEYSPGTISDPDVSVANQSVKIVPDANRNDRFDVRFQLPGNMGRVIGGYSAVDYSSRDEDYQPGQYIFGESLAFTVPTGNVGAPGVNDDAFSDGYLYSTATSLREWVIAYQRDAFRTQRVEGRWSIGWRSTRHRRNQDATYYAVLSPLPPLLPPTTDCVGTPEDVPGGVLLNCALSPQPDTAAVGSTYDGRGLEARFEVDINLWRDKLVLETGAGYTVQRGKMTADFSGTNNYYICTGDAIDPSTGEGCHTGDIVTYPFSEISQLIPNPGGQPIQVSDSVAQQSVSAGTLTQTEGASSDILDIDIALRWRIMDWFEVSGGFRTTSYSNVGLDLIPQDVTRSVSGALVVPRTTVKKTSVTYEGFFIGLLFSFF